MRPLVLLVVAQVLVVLDLRIDGLDLVPDPLGWALTALALLRLERHVAFVVGAVAAGVAVVVSLPAMLDPTAVTGLEQVLGWLRSVVVFATCTGVMARRPRTRRTAQVLRWTDVGVLAALEVLTRGAGTVGVLPADGRAVDLGDVSGAQAVVAVLAVVLLLVGLVAYVWFLVWCVQVARTDPASPASEPTTPAAR